MSKKVFIFWAVFIALAIFRVVQSSYIEMVAASDCVKQLVVGRGTISEEPTRTESGQVIVVDPKSVSAENISCTEVVDERGEMTSRIRMKTKLYPKLAYGDEVDFSGKLGMPFNFQRDTGRSFDFQNYLAKDEIYFEIKSAYVIVASSSVATNLVANKSGGIIDRSLTNITSALYKVKLTFVSYLEKTLGEPHAALAAGLVVGEKSALGKELLNDFRTVGLIHIVVLSGFNITIVADAIKRLLAFLPRVWGIVLGGIGIVLFGMLVGGGSTVVRSCFMASIALCGDLLRRDYNVVRALIFAGLLMIIQSPMILFHDPSFQLSFLATLGLIFLASPIEKRLTFITEKLGMRGILASTFATQIFVSPFILYIMGQLSIIGVFANILVLPLIPITMLFVFLTGASGFLYLGVSQLFAWISHLLLSYELLIVESFAKIPFASIQVPIFSYLYVVVFYAAFFIIYAFVQTKSFARSPPS